MTPLPGTDAKRNLTVSLAAVAARLHAGDLVGASEKIQDLVAACRDCENAGVRLDDKELATATALLERCGSLANAAGAILHRRNMQAGASGQARKRYSVP